MFRQLGQNPNLFHFFFDGSPKCYHISLISITISIWLQSKQHFDHCNCELSIYKHSWISREIMNICIYLYQKNNTNIIWKNIRIRKYLNIFEYSLHSDSDTVVRIYNAYPTNTIVNQINLETDIFIFCHFSSQRLGLLYCCIHVDILDCFWNTICFIIISSTYYFWMIGRWHNEKRIEYNYSTEKKIFREHQHLRWSKIFLLWAYIM